MAESTGAQLGYICIRLPHRQRHAMGKRAFRYKKPTCAGLAQTPTQMFGPANLLKFQAEPNDAALRQWFESFLGSLLESPPASAAPAYATLTGPELP